MSDDVHIKEINKGIENCLSEEYVSGQKINDDIYSALGIKRNIKNKSGKDESIFLKNIENTLLNKKTKAEKIIEDFSEKKGIDFFYE